MDKITNKKVFVEQTKLVCPCCGYNKNSINRLYEDNTAELVCLTCKAIWYTEYRHIFLLK